jgi:hypothetical protein
MSPFDIVNTISYTKKLKEDVENFDAAYIPFLINRNISFFVDTLNYANEMNMNPHLSKKMQYDYYFHSLLPKKRFAKWPKKVIQDENLELVKQYFGYNNEKAKAALHILNEEQIEKIKETFVKGGRINDK